MLKNVTLNNTLYPFKIVLETKTVLQTNIKLICQKDHKLVTIYSAAVSQELSMLKMQPIWPIMIWRISI